MERLNKITDKQRAANHKLISEDLPEIIASGSRELPGDCTLKCEMFQLSVDDIRSDAGTDYYPIKMKCNLRRNSTEEEIEFCVDLIKLPAFQELGYKISGNYMQVLDSYDKMIGWLFSKSQRNSEKYPTIVAKCMGAYGKSFQFVFDEKRQVTVQVTNIETKSTSRLPVSVFFKALTGMSNYELLDVFGVGNPYVTTAFSTDDHEEELSRAACINKLAVAVLGESKSSSLKSTKLKLKVINDMFFKSKNLDLGEYNAKRFEWLQSFKHRAEGKILAETIKVSDQVYEAGTILTNEILELIDASPISTMKVKHGEKTYDLKKFSVLTFRALGMILAEDVPEVGLSAGTLLGLEELQILNDSKVSEINVKKRRKAQKILMSRRVSARSLNIDDIFTAFSMWTDNLNGLDVFDKQYELTNRICVPFEQIVRNVVHNNVNTVINTIEKSLNAAEESLVHCVTDFKINLNELIEKIKDTDHGNGQISEMCNIVAFASKNSKISTDINANNANTEMISVQDTQEGRLDSFDSPESAKIGIVHNKTLLAELDEAGSLTTPYLEVKNGKVVSDKPVYVDATTAVGKNIAMWNETFTNDDGTPKEKIKVLCDGEVTSVSPDKVHYKEYSCIQSLSLAHSLVTFPGHSNGKRIYMLCNQIRQIVDTIHNERPIVGSGMESVLDIGTYVAKDLLETYYSNHVAEYKMFKEHKEDILNSKIKLIGIKHNDETRTFTFRVLAVQKLNEQLKQHCADTFPLTVPYNMRNFEQSSFTYKLNHVHGRVYKPEDVVAYNSGYSLKGSDRVDLLDFGGLDVSNVDFNRGLALGKNLLCGYKTYKSRTIDDAIAISSRLVYDEELTHKRFMLITDTCHSSSEMTEKFGVADIKNDVNQGYFEYNGLPKVGTKLKPGDKIISKLQETANGTKTKFKRVPVNMEGQVVRAFITQDQKEEVANVILALRADIECGDKLAGRHGNKGVVAEIVPQEEMPFDPVLGRELDIMLNPLGVPSRQNLSQLLEVALGMCRYLDGKQSYVSPYHPDDLQFVKDQVKEFNVHPRELIDGRTGQKFKRPINVGVIYMNKLHHTAASKIHSVGMNAPVDPVFLQPRKGSKRQGGQSIGEMENWCLHGVGAFKVLEDLYGFQSDDVSGRAEFENLAYVQGGVSPKHVNSTNHNDATFKAFLRVMGVDLVSDSEEGCYELRPMTDNRTIALAFKPVESKAQLHSSSIFGSEEGLKNKEKGKDRWSWIDLCTEIVHPIWVENGQLFKYLSVAGRSLTKNNIHELFDNKFYVVARKPEDGISFDGYSAEEVAKDDFAGEDVSGELLTGVPALVYVLKNADELAIEKKLEDSINAKKSKAKDLNELYRKQSFIKLLKEYEDVKSFNRSGEKLSDYVISAFPVLPPAFRPVIKMQKQRSNASSDFDHYYEQILIAVRNIKAAATNENIKVLYDRIAEFTGLKKSDNSKKFKNLQEYFIGRGSDDKHGKFRSAAQSKRVFCSGRAVITPARYEISPVQLGVPSIMLLTAYEPLIVPYFISKFKCKDVHWMALLTQVALNRREQFMKIYEKHHVSTKLQMRADTAFTTLREAFKAFFLDVDENGEKKDPQVVLAGRQPSLHKYSIRAFYPVPIDSFAIEISSLVCAGYNADFDGDQMWFTAMLSEDAKVEAIEKLSPRVDFLNPKNNSIMLEHTQDIALGCYCATMLKDNAAVCEQTIADAKYYNSITALRTDVELGFTEPYDLVYLSVAYDLDDVHHYLSTAGRILFNAIFEDGFTEEPFDNPLRLAGVDSSKISKLKYDGIITSGKPGGSEVIYYNLQDICKQYYLDYNNQGTSTECISIYYDIQKFGFQFSDMYGVTISIDDLDIESNKEEILKEVNEKRALIEQDYQNGLIAKEDMTEAIVSLYTNDEWGANPRIMNTLISNLPRNNNLFIMMDSGARGNKTQIMHMCGAIGMLEKTKTETMSDSMTSNYFEGLTTFDVHMASYSSRTGVASTQRETREAGYSTRKVVYMTDGLRITESDCGKTDWWYDIIWDDPIKELARFSPSKEWFDKKLLGKNLVESDIEIPTEGGKLCEASLSILQDKGFNKITVEMDGKKEVFNASPDILLGATILPADVQNQKIFKNLLNEYGEFNHQCAKAFDHYKVMNILTSFGNLSCKYKMAQVCSSELLYREARNLKYLTTTLNRATGETVNYISKDTIAYIERNGIERVQARVMLDCKAKHGVCAHCYGLKFSNLQLPAIGEYVGTEAAQAIGEPAAQLTMNVINKGGAAGASIASGIDVFGSYLNGSVIGGSNAKTADIAQESGYVKIQKMDNAVGVYIEPENKECEMCKKCLDSVESKTGTRVCPLELGISNVDAGCMLPDKTPQNKLCVLDGEWVDSGYPVTDYPIISNTVTSVKGSKDIRDVLRRKQMIWIQNYFNVFNDRSIKINARHFEILAMVQNQYATVVDSQNPDFEVGGVYEISDLLTAGEDVKYMLQTVNKEEVITRNSGLIAGLTFADQTRLIAKTTMSNFKSDAVWNNSPLSRITVGQDFESVGPKELQNFEVPIIRKEVAVTHEEFSPEIVTVENANVGIDLGLDEMSEFSFDDVFAETEEPNDTVPIVEEKKAMECTIVYLLNGETIQSASEVVLKYPGDVITVDYSKVPSGNVLAPGMSETMIVEDGKEMYEFRFITDPAYFMDDDFEEDLEEEETTHNSVDTDSMSIFG